MIIEAKPSSIPHFLPGTAAHANASTATACSSCFQAGARCPAGGVPGQSNSSRPPRCACAKRMPSIYALCLLSHNAFCFAPPTQRLPTLLHVHAQMFSLGSSTICAVRAGQLLLSGAPQESNLEMLQGRRVTHILQVAHASTARCLHEVHFVPLGAVSRPTFLCVHSARMSHQCHDRHCATAHALQVGAELRPSHPDRFVYERVSIEDVETADIVQHLPRCLKFIDDSINGGGSEPATSTCRSRVFSAAPVGSGCRAREVASAGTGAVPRSSRARPEGRRALIVAIHGVACPPAADDDARTLPAAVAPPRAPQAAWCWCTAWPASAAPPRCASPT